MVSAAKVCRLVKDPDGEIMKIVPVKLEPPRRVVP